MDKNETLFHISEAEKRINNFKVWINRMDSDQFDKTIEKSNGVWPVIREIVVIKERLKNFK